MTVIREKQSYRYPKANSTATSDTESLHLGSVSASDTESLNDEPRSSGRIRIYGSTSVRASHVGELLDIKKSSGKKKIRRHQNKCVLQTLNEDDEDNDFIVVMEPYKTPFTRLLEDKAAMEYWQEFIEKSENEQKEILEAFSNSVKDNESYLFRKEKPGRVSAKIKRTFRIRKNLSIEIVQSSEADLITFFKNTPRDTYIKYPPTSFDRLLLHGIAQYHRLNSISVFSEDGAKRSVQVYNTVENWVPADCFLSDFIKQLRKIN